MNIKIKRITFIWNADFSVAGGLNALKEIWQGKHTCTLCEIAYHRVTQTKEWQAYRRQLTEQYGAEIRQPCRNQITKEEYDLVEGDYPAVLAYTQQGIVKLLGSKEIDACDGEFSTFKSKLDSSIKKAIKG